MFCIETPSLTLMLEIVRVDGLLMHEEVLPAVARKLLFEFKNLANLQNPIIVDQNNIVLDGNHRAYAFRQLSFRHIPVCRIDYFNENAKLRFWFRMLKNVERFDTFTHIIQERNGRIQPVESAVALTDIMRKECLACGLQCGDRYYCVRFPCTVVKDAVCAYDVLREIEKTATARHMNLSYIPCKYAGQQEFCRTLTQTDIVIWTPRISKAMVVEAARRKKVFAPKTTRHLIPARPLNVDVPGLWLKDPVSTDDLNRTFKRYLQEKRIRRFPPGQVVYGRYYEEELFVFY